MDDINVEEELQKVHKDMEDAEDDLEATGFSVAQWMLIKQYILSAIHQQQLIDLWSTQMMKVG